MKDINSLFPLAGNQFSITETLSTKKVLGETLERLTNGQPIVVSNATRTVVGDQVKISGTSDLLNVKDISTNIIGQYDTNGDVDITAFFTLIDGQPTPSSWKFDISFPDLPNFYVGITSSKTSTGNKTDFLNSLLLSDASFILSTEDKGIDPKTNAPYSSGFNFASDYKMQGISGLVTSILGSNNSKKLYGPILIPLTGEVSPPRMNTYQQPWQYEDPAPGIFLTADLGIDFNPTDKLKFSGVNFKIYSPISKKWQEKNSTYSPITSLCSSVNIPSAAIDLEILCLNPFSPNNLFFYGIFSGVTIGKLEDLLDISGGSDLSSSLPKDVQSGLSTLKKLELEAINIQLGKGMKVVSAGVTIGMKDLNTSVLSGFELKSLSANFSVINPFESNRSLQVFLEGDVNFAGAPFKATLDITSLTATASLQQDTTIPLNSLFTKAGLPAPPDLTVNTMNLSMSKNGSYSFAGGLAPAPGWTLDLGPVPLTIKDVTIIASKNSGQSAAGSFSGSLSISDKLNMFISYNTPGSFYLKSELPDVSLNDILKPLTNQSLSIPDKFDLTFTDSSVVIQADPNSTMFQLATNYKDLGLLALQVQKINSQWGVAFGLDMTNGLPSSLPGLSYLSSFESLFKMNKFMLVISSFDAPSFNFPDTANFSNPTLGTKNIQLPSQASSLVAGLNVYAEWSIDTNNKQQKLLQKFLGTDPTLGITLQVSKVPTDNSKLFVSYKTTIQKHPFTCMFGGQIRNKELGLFLTGSLTVDIQNQPQTFDVTLLFVTNGAFLSATMKGKTAINFEVFKLSNLALEAGINFEGIPSLGVAATIDVSTFESSIAVFFDSTDPAKSLVAGAVSDLHLGDVLDAFTGDVIPSDIDKVLNTVAIKGTNSFKISGSLANDLDNLVLDNVAAACKSMGGLIIPTAQNQFLLVVNTKGALWYLTDMTKMRHYAFIKSGSDIVVSTEAQFYCAPQTTSIGSSLTPFKQGFYINGAIEFLGFEASMTVDIDTSKGISVDAQMDPIIIGNKSLFSITAAEGNGGPLVSISTYTNPAQKIEKFIPPHFYVNGAIEILGFSKHAYVSISSSGASFDIGGDIFPLVSGDLNGTFKSITDLKVDGELNVGIKAIDLGPLGTFNIDTGAEADADFYVNSSDIGADLGVKFMLAGDSLNVGTISLDVKTQTIEDLPSILFKAIKDFLIDLFKDPKKWAEYAKKALGWAIDKIKDVLSKTFHLAEEVINGIVDGLSKVCAMTEAVGSLVTK